MVDPIPVLGDLEDILESSQELDAMFGDPIFIDESESSMEDLIGDAMELIESDSYGSPEDLSFLPQLK